MSSYVKNSPMLPRSCDTFVVLPPHTKTGEVIFGKNADRPPNEVQEITYIKGGIREARVLTCTYITIAQTSQPVNDVILSKPAWMWGAEMGSNNKNVAIGNESVRTRWNIGCGDSNIKRLIGADLVRLGLERGNSAEGAVDVITTLLEEYGQGGPCVEEDMGYHCYHNSFLIADPLEAWVLETSGSMWAAERIESGYKNISNGLTITTKIDKHSLDLQGKTRRYGLWDGRREFNFAECYGNGGDEIRQHAGQKLLRESSVGFDVRDMMNILRNKESHICRTNADAMPTQGSQVSSLHKEVSVHWMTGTYDPSISFFKPFIFSANPQISEHTLSPLEPGRQHLLYKLHDDCQQKGNTESALVHLNALETRFVNELDYITHKINGGEAFLEYYDNVMKSCVESEVNVYLPN